MNTGLEKIVLPLKHLSIFLSKFLLPWTAKNMQLEGAFTRQRRNGTDPTKTGTVPIVCVFLILFLDLH